MTLFWKIIGVTPKYIFHFLINFLGLSYLLRCGYYYILEDCLLKNLIEN